MAFFCHRVTMERRNIIVVGASAGGLEAIRRFVAGFPPDTDVSILIVWHIAPNVTGILPRVLNKDRGLFATHAVDGERLETRRVYIAPPDHHLVVERDVLRVSKGPKENRFRPAIDPLFRSAALVYGPRVIGIILSGALSDGSAGLWAVKNFGGIAVVQDPNEAEVQSMPQSALNAVQVDYKLKVSEMGPVIQNLSTELVDERPPDDSQEAHHLAQEVDIAMGKTAAGYKVFEQRKISRLTCPDCHGALSSISEGGLVRFRCHTGHAFSIGALLDNIGIEIEEYLWNAVRAAQEATMLLNNLGDHFAEYNDPKTAAMYFNKAKETERRLSAILTALHFHESMPADVAAENAKTTKVI
jgi:two-component system chemotaxis response regulator CheB